MKRAVVLGLDGACWEGLNIYFQLGFMPYLETLMKNSSRGILKSTLPAITPVAWTSLITGRHPSGHGIFGFTKNKYQDVNAVKTLVNRTHIRVPTIYDIVRECRVPILSVNIPMSYPAPEVPGMVISGMMTPPGGTHWIYPQEEQYRIKELGIDYAIDMDLHYLGDNKKKEFVLDLNEQSIREFFRDLTHVIEERERAVRYALKKDWRIFLINFIGLDRIQHFFWDHLVFISRGDVSRPATRAVRHELENYLRLLDGILEKLTLDLGEDDLLVVCSDHGFGHYSGEFYLNRWLQKEGFLKEKAAQNRGRAYLKKLARNIGLSRIMIQTSKRVLNEKKVDRWISRYVLDINWKHTRAFVECPFGIRINLAGREPQGIVQPEEYNKILENLKASLYRLRDTSGEIVISKALSQKDLYPRAERIPEYGPDIIIEFKNEHYYGAYSDSLRIKDEFAEKEYKKGGHRREGIIMLQGKAVDLSRKDLVADIVDVLPTVLYHVGIPQDSRFDGKIINHVFSHFDEEKIERKEYLSEDLILGPDDSGHVRKRLKSLGYMD